MGYRILAVDDDPEILEMIKIVLKDDYEVLALDKSKLALDVLNDCEPDLILLDVVMPEMDGFMLCENIREKSKYHSTPIFFLSVKDNMDLIKKGYSKGANLFLGKPINPDRLKKNVDVFFEKNVLEPRPKKFKFVDLKSSIHKRKIEESARKIEETRRQALKRQHQAELDREKDKWRKKKEEEEKRRAENKLRVLLVDDDRDILELMEVSLINKYDVITASNGVEALDKAMRCEPDLMILDLMLPKMNGFQVMDGIRLQRKLRNISVIFLSAKHDKGIIDKAMRMGALGFLAKPFDSESLIEKIEHFKLVPKIKEETIGEIYKKEEILERQKAAKRKKLRINTKRKIEIEALENERDFID